MKEEISSIPKIRNSAFSYKFKILANISPRTTPAGYEPCHGENLGKKCRPFTNNCRSFSGRVEESSLTQLERQTTGKSSLQ